MGIGIKERKRRGKKKKRGQYNFRKRKVKGGAGRRDSINEGLRRPKRELKCNNESPFKSTTHSTSLVS
jgi:hypothetical protein